MLQFKLSWVWLQARQTPNIHCFCWHLAGHPSFHLSAARLDLRPPSPSSLPCSRLHLLFIRPGICVNNRHFASTKKTSCLLQGLGMLRYVAASNWHCLVQIADFFWVNQLEIVGHNEFDFKIFKAAWLRAWIQLASRVGSSENGPGTLIHHFSWQSQSGYHADHVSLITWVPSFSFKTRWMSFCQVSLAFSHAPEQQTRTTRTRTTTTATTTTTTTTTTRTATTTTKNEMRPYKGTVGHHCPSIKGMLRKYFLKEF